MDIFSLNNNNIQWTTRKVLTTDKDPFMGSICGDCEHLSQQITEHTYKIQNIKDYQEISIYIYKKKDDMHYGRGRRIN